MHVVTPHNYIDWNEVLNPRPDPTSPAPFVVVPTNPHALATNLC